MKGGAGNERFAGAWRLVTAEYRHGGKVLAYPFGPNPVGLLMYDAMGNMSVQIMQPNRAALADVSARQRAEDEGRAAFDGYLGYYGTYRILPHEQTIIHHLTGSSLAHWDGAQVVRWDPQTAAPLASIKVPVTRPTSCVFGGEDFGTLYITSASTRLSAESVATQPLAGSLFSCRPGVTGLPMWEFAG